MLINNYRQGLAPDKLKSVWLNREIIDFILENGGDGINGLRVYLAKYPTISPTLSEDESLVAEISAIESASAPRETVVVVPTVEGADGPQDMENGYFNYGAPCPHACSGDVGNQNS